MSDFKPLGYALLTIMIFGTMIPYVLGFFVDTSQLEDYTLTGPIASIIGFDLEFGFWSFFTVDLNPFGWLGNTLQDFFENNVTNLNIYPEWMASIILIMTIFAMLFALIKLLPTT